MHRYRKRYQDWQSAQPLHALSDPTALQIKVPTLFILATRDAALTPRMSRGMDRFFSNAKENLKVVEVEASHWVHWEKKEEVNRVLGDWFGERFGLRGGKGNGKGGGASEGGREPGSGEKVKSLL